MLARLAYRMATEVSPRLLAKAGWLWVYKGLRAVAAYKRRVRRGELFPPFLFLALTNACNLRCHGCWIDAGGPTHRLTLDQIDGIIRAGRKQQSYFYTLLGGEPMVYPDLWKIIEGHRDCYFQIITNGTYFTEQNVARLAAAGNVTPLVSIDGPQPENDARRGAGVFQAVLEGMARLKRRKLLFGVATTATAANLDAVTSDDYVRDFIRRGAMYLWYYAFRPMGGAAASPLCLSAEQMLQLRRRLLELRRRHPIVLIDTYWDAEGRAVCPAALGLGFHIGPQGSIEPCPPLSFARERVSDNDGDLFRTINQSEFLRGVQQFIHTRTCGCMILEAPQALAEYLRAAGAVDYSGRGALLELAAGTPHASHHLAGQEMPEDFWFYRMLKSKLFFGMGGYG